MPRANEIVIRVFLETGKDGPKFADGAIEYIDQLEMLILWQDKELTRSMRRKSRSDIHKLLQDARRIKELK